MASGGQTRSELGRYVAKTLVVASAYFVTAKLGLKLAFAHASITAVWPPTGISLAALVIWGYRLWPGVALGAVLANTFTGDAPAICPQPGACGGSETWGPIFSSHRSFSCSRAVRASAWNGRGWPRAARSCASLSGSVC